MTPARHYDTAVDLQKLIDIMARLRSEKGCPWDKEQTRESLKPFIVEEAFEVLEAIDEGTPDAIREELGDLLFQIVFQSRIGEERGEFTIADVIDSIAGKMISRHPHVFGDKEVSSSGEVIANWDEHKKREGKQRDSLLDGVPKAMPSLLRAHKLQSRASRVGFDWDKTEDVLPKLYEEIDEFRTALASGNQEEIEDELGDVFFVLVNISRFVGVNPEDALRKTISKFISRFRYIEMAAADQGRTLSDMTLAEMDSLWDEAKKKPGK